MIQIPKQYLRLALFLTWLILFCLSASYLYNKSCRSKECLLVCGNLHNLDTLDDIRSPVGIPNKHVRRVLIGNETFIIKSAPLIADETEELRAMRLHYLQKEVDMLKTVQMDGIPKLILTCNRPNEFEYVMEDIEGEALCDDDYGTDDDCLNLKKLRKMITSQVKSDPNIIEKRIWTIIERMTSLFYNLYNQNLWVEDLSGSNFVITPELSVYLVDLDSIKTVRSDEVKCLTSSDCTDGYLTTNLWSEQSLNRKISWNCPEINNPCQNKQCLSYRLLNPCSIGNWIFKRLSIDLPEIETFESLAWIRTCATEPNIEKRCSIEQINRLAKQNLLWAYNK